jgi:hypothetical protein
MRYCRRSKAASVGGLYFEHHDRIAEIAVFGTFGPDGSALAVSVHCSSKADFGRVHQYAKAKSKADRSTTCYENALAEAAA